jgi:hypothetical protein
MGRLRRHITYANVVATMALVIAFSGGVVYAANKIGAQGIRKNAIRSYHIRNKQVKRQDIAGGSINGRKVSNDSLTGKDIKEASLGLVPSAQDARTVNGISERAVTSAQPDPAGLSQVLSESGLTVLMSCGASATLQVHGVTNGDAGSIFDSGGGTQEFDSASTATVSTGGADPGFITVRRIDGTVTRLDFELDRSTNGFGSTNDCFFQGFLLSGK